MPTITLARVNVVLAFAGLFIASMLSMSNVLGIELPCGIGSGCDLVTQDPRSRLLGIPFAYYGLFGYALITAIALLRLLAPDLQPKLLRGFGYALSLAGLFISIGLTVFSIRSIHALCTWCIASAVTMSLLFASHSVGAIKVVEQSDRRSRLDGVWVVVLACALMAGLTTAAGDLRKAEAKSLKVDRAALATLDDDDLLPPGVHITGPKSARATVLMFGDLTCPVCREAYETISSLMRRRHDFRLAFRHLPLSFHPFARPAALISEMAAENGRFWDYLAACYGSSAITSMDDLVNFGQEVGLNASEIKRRLNDPRDPAAKTLDRDAEMTGMLGLHSTPSVFMLIDGYYPEPITYRGIEQMLDGNLGTRRRSGGSPSGVA